MLNGFTVAGVVITAIAALGFAVKIQRDRIATLRSDLAAAESRIVGYEELSRFNARSRAADVEWSKMDDELGVSDAPLSDYMSGVAGRVWP